MKNPQAFPSVVPQGLVNGVNDGMTLRDYFAAAALAMMACKEGLEEMSYNDRASTAYKQADAMLKERGQ